MASLNKVFLMGNLTRDPEVRFTPGGAALCKFGLAVNRRYATSSGEEREETCFVDIEVWGKQAESCGNYLRKGSPALVEGRLRLDQWEDRDGGGKRSRLLVSAERVQFIGRPAGRAEFDGQGGEELDDAPPAASQQQPRQAPQRRQDGGGYGGGNRQQQSAPPSQPPPEMPPFKQVSEVEDDIPF